MTQVAWSHPVSLVEDSLAAVLPRPVAGEPRATLHEAMRYAVLGGGKRLRALLLLEAAVVVGGERATAAAVRAACALELIHAYSLVHDDLPAMDDAATRRGRPSCHASYGEATAVLVGDGLLTLAFETLAQPDLSAAGAVRALTAALLIARAAGEAGMVGGQAIDMSWSHNAESVNGEALLAMHSLKTGALIRCATEVGAVLGGGNDDQIERLRRYGAHLGCAFQIADDLLDVTGDPEATGKAASDMANGKKTAPALFGMAGAQALAAEAGALAIEALSGFGAEAGVLRDAARYVIQREN